MTHPLTLRIQQQRDRQGESPLAEIPAVEPVRREQPVDASLRTAAAGAALLAFAWAYWPTLSTIVAAWNREPDYSHGFLVVPFALYFLWFRRDGFPGLSAGFGWMGLSLVAASLCMRTMAARYFVDALDGWSILLWTAGVVWVLCGLRVLVWSWPSIAFLAFAVPLPWHAERMVSGPLQRVATELSCWIFQILGQGALAEGNTILLNDVRLNVEEACSGLRIFMGVVALAFAYVIVTRRVWWEKLVLLASVVPVALLANALRIVGTGLLYQVVTSRETRRLIHDVEGFGMILMAAALFALVLWYLGLLIRDGEQVNVGDVLRKNRDVVR
jgi:exosortase